MDNLSKKSDLRIECENILSKASNTYKNITLILRQNPQNNEPSLEKLMD